MALYPEKDPSKADAESFTEHSLGACLRKVKAFGFADVRLVFLGLLSGP
jgi:hypothetical protein